MSRHSGLLTRIRRWLRRERPLAADEGGPARSLHTFESHEPADSVELTDEERSALTLHVPDEADPDDALGIDADLDDDPEVRIVGKVTPDALPPAPDDAVDLRDPDDAPPRALVVTDPDGLLARQQAREQRLVDGVQQLADLLGTIRTGIQVQQDRQQEVLEKFDRLPEFLEQVPATGKAQLALLETLEQEVSRAGHTSAELASHLKQLPALLQSIPQMIDSQSTLLGQMADRLGTQTRHGREMVTSLEAMRNCLGQVAATSERQVRCMASMELAHQRNMEALADGLEDQGHRTTVLLATALGIGAVTLAGVLFLASVISQAGLLGN